MDAFDLISEDEIQTTHTCGVCGSTPCARLVHAFEVCMNDVRYPDAEHRRRRVMPRAGVRLLEQQVHGRDVDGGALGMLSVHDIRTVHPCGRCGQVGCPVLLGLLDRMLQDPDTAARVYAEPEGIGAADLARMAEAAHDMAEGRHVGGGAAGGADQQHRCTLPAHAPWRVESLRKHFGTERIAELAEKVNESNEKRRLMALMKANGDVDTAAALLESEGEARARESEAGSPQAPPGAASYSLCQAIVNGEADTVARQLDAEDRRKWQLQHAWRFVTDEGSVTVDDDWDLLRVAAVEGHVAVCRVLVENGASAHLQQNSSGRTVAYSAAWAGQLTTLKFLHEQCSADVGAPDYSGSTPLWAAASAGHKTVVSYLLQQAAELSTPQRRLQALSTVSVILKNLAKEPNNPKFRTLRKTNARIQVVLSTGCEHLLKQAGFSQDASSDENLVVLADVNARKISRLQDIVAGLKEQATPSAGLVRGAPEGARVVRGPDWRWNDQDGGDGREGTVVGPSHRNELEARVVWDAGHANLYRTGNHDQFDLIYAPEPREAADAAAERLNRTEVSACFAAARWWQDTPTSEVMRSLDGTLKHDHLGTCCDSCKVSPIRGVRYIYEGPDSAPENLCEACMEKLSSAKRTTSTKDRLTAAQRQCYRPLIHQALGVFEDNLKFCRAHGLHELAHYLELREKRTLVRAKQRLRWAQGLKTADEDYQTALWSLIDVDCVARVADWLTRGPAPADFFVFRVLGEDAGDGLEVPQMLLHLRPEMRVVKAWLDENHLPPKFLRHISAGLSSKPQDLFVAGIMAIDHDEADEIQTEPEESHLPCVKCQAPLHQYQSPDDEYECDKCGACPTHFYCSAGCDYELCQSCYDGAKPDGSKADGAKAESTDEKTRPGSDSEEGVPPTRATQMFKRNLVEFRRVRQLVDPRRTARTGPKFTEFGVGIHAERSEVESIYFPKWLEAGWDIGSAIMLLWAGVTDIDELCAGIDLDSRALVQLIIKADDDEYLQPHRALCRARRFKWADLDYEERENQRVASSELEPEPEPPGEQSRTVQVVADLFDFAKKFAEGVDPPDQIKQFEWTRFQRCAKALPHQAPRLGLVRFSDQAEETPKLQDFLTFVKLDCHQALESLGMLLQDVPFTTEADLCSAVELEGHRKRFVRHGKKLPLVEKQRDKYDYDWIQRTTEKLVPDILSADIIGRLCWLSDPKYDSIDSEFEANLRAYRRIRQLVDAGYAMSTQARSRCRGRLCEGGFETERQFARDNIPTWSFVGVALERMWRGESAVQKMIEGLNDDQQMSVAHKRRLVELIFYAESSEFDKDVAVHDMIAYDSDRQLVERKFHTDM